VRAVVEGFAFFIKDIAGEVRKSGVEIKSFVLAEGLASLTSLSQIQTDIRPGCSTACGRLMT